jgi:hypothetical protein
LTAKEGALELLATRALDKQDVKLLRLMTKQVGVALNGQRGGYVHPGTRAVRAVGGGTLREPTNSDGSVTINMLCIILGKPQHVVNG